MTTVVKKLKKKSRANIRHARGLAGRVGELGPYGESMSLSCEKNKRRLGGTKRGTDLARPTESRLRAR